MLEDKKKGIVIDLGEEGKIDIKVNGIDGITAVFILNTAMQMVNKRIQDNSKLIIAADVGQLPGLRRTN